jgi:hypothetical protein
MIKRILGVILFLMGLTLLCWVGYNLFIERLPEAEGRNPIPAILFTIGLLYVGQKWIRNKGKA